MNKKAKIDIINENDLEIEQFLAKELPSEIIPDFNKQINKQINRRIQKIATRTVAVILGGIIFLLLIISPVMDLCVVNPNNYHSETNDTLFRTMRAYIEMQYPYKNLSQVVDIEKRGFGRYDLELNIVDHSLQNNTTGNVVFSIERGKVELKEDNLNMLLVYLNRFDSKVYPKDQKAEKKQLGNTIEEIKKLPDSAHLYLSVSDKEIQTYEALKNEDVQLWWLQLNQPGCEYAGGINLFRTVAIDKEDHNVNTSTKLLKNYTENLQILLDHTDLWDSRELISADGTRYMSKANMELLRKSLEQAQGATEVKTNKYCISGSKEQILKFLESHNLEYVHVDDIRLSTLDW